MANLTETAYYARRAINWSILTVIGYVLLKLSWSVFVILWLAIFPPKPVPPNVAFGTLPSIKFPQQASPSAQIAYQLETIEGGVPPASGSANVYFMPKSTPNLLGLNQAQQFAQKMQFDPTPIQESKNVYRFMDVTEPLRRLRFDIVSKNFILRYGFEQDNSAFITRNIPSTDAVKLEVINLLQTYDLYQTDYKQGPIKITYLRLTGNRLSTTTSLSQADAVRVDFFRKQIGPSRIVTPNPDEGSISVILSGNTNMKKRVLQFAYTYWPVDYQTIATYPLKSSATAWQELQQGQGYIARNPSNTTSVTVRNISIGYYDSLDPQTYLQPVFVFEGDSDFVAYVPAVSPEWTEP